MKRKKSIRVKLLIVPLLVVFITISAITVITSFVTHKGFMEEMEVNGYKMIDELLARAHDHQVAIQMIESHVEEMMLGTARVISRKQGLITSAYLEQVARDTGIEEVNYYSHEGQVLYSSVDAYIGWQATEEHPVHQFMEQERAFHFDPIRRNSEEDFYVKYAYFRLPEGDFLQLGMNADQIAMLTDAFNMQSLLEKFAQADEVVYALFTDLDYKAVAHSDPSRVGIDLSDDLATKQAINEGKLFSATYVYEVDQSRVLDVIAPLYVHDELIGAVNVGLSLQRMDATMSRNLWIIIGTGLTSLMLLSSLLFSSSQYAIATIEDLRRIINKMAIGDYSIEVSRALMEKNDELGEFSQAIDRMKKVSKENYHLANFDALTNIPNRPNIINQLNRAIKSYALTQSKFAVLIFDIDYFKSINDAHGHLIGDEVIKHVAQKVDQSLEGHNAIGRFGGDEFIILQHHVGDLIDVIEMVEMIFDALKEPIVIQHKKIDVKISIGISIYPTTAGGLNALLSQADHAMYEAKAIKGNAYKFYS